CPQDGTPHDAKEQLQNLLSSNYEFIGTVGTGGMSVIYKARQLLLNKTVAIKMLHSHLLNEHSIMRFQQEAKAASSLNHPNVISVHDFGISKLG
ncbi:protein kinase domain-containing protein, partial [Streptococcus suis]